MSCAIAVPQQHDGAVFASASIIWLSVVPVLIIERLTIDPDEDPFLGLVCQTDPTVLEVAFLCPLIDEGVFGRILDDHEAIPNAGTTFL
jgi:hypothetical protein